MVCSRRGNRRGTDCPAHPSRCPLAGSTPLALAVAVLLLQSGCGSNESVRHYKVPKPEVLYAANHVDTTEKGATPGTERTVDQLLGAIVPRAAETWFFKMAGPASLVAQQEPAFRQFIESLRFAGPDAAPQWTLPQTWQESEGTGQRLATLSVEVEGQKLEVSIIQLATSPSPDTILDNVNRWREQMDLPTIDMQQLDDESTILRHADGTAIFVNLIGSFDGGSRGNASLASQRAGSAAKPPASGLTYEKPDAWMDEPPAPMSMLTFGVRDGDATAHITLSLLPGDAGGLLANVNRWFDQAGLPSLEENDLATRTEEVEVEGIPGTYVEAVGEDLEAEGEGVVGWIGALADQTWFVKMKGDRKLVQAQRATFRDFLKTLKISANDGASHGN